MGDTQGVSERLRSTGSAINLPETPLAGCLNNLIFQTCEAFQIWILVARASQAVFFFAIRSLII